MARLEGSGVKPLTSAASPQWLPLLEDSRFALEIELGSDAPSWLTQSTQRALRLPPQPTGFSTGNLHTEVFTFMLVALGTPLVVLGTGKHPKIWEGQSRIP
ncbi:hypothetical protein I8752_33225 [Nostocaceae cyanobacterium CENA369]|uniref:Uncharacterized protein n=1 Tax=Dendronalium phyllosphericum CENA369 TaxID=1725256 RepID=A0A8J7LJX6_9NOST|nr:hypothetical protein [Dendronalium phyllosphericum]MBH8577744.1 hypothetical protein [Dendronalium phyllosphericum CENA369]